MSKVKFKNTGKTLKDYNKSKKVEDRIAKNKKLPIGIDFPLKNPQSSSDSLFKMTYSIEDQVSVNLKNLILTRKGEMLCKPDFGTNLASIYHRTDIEDLDDIIMKDISETVSKYMPYVSLVNFSSNKVDSTSSNNAYMQILIDYTVESLKEKRTIDIKLLISG